MCFKIKLFLISSTVAVDKRVGVQIDAGKWRGPSMKIVLISKDKSYGLVWLLRKNPGVSQGERFSCLDLSTSIFANRNWDQHWLA